MFKGRIGLDSEKEVLKIVVVGGSQAGKTSIITRYLQNSFVEHASDETGKSPPFFLRKWKQSCKRKAFHFQFPPQKKHEFEIGIVNMRLKTLRKNDCTIHMEIWDVPARRKVNINSVVYENCHGVVFVLDACSLISLDMTSALLKEMKQDIGVVHPPFFSSLIYLLNSMDQC